jgi:hypothetical protein
MLTDLNDLLYMGYGYVPLVDSLSQVNCMYHQPCEDIKSDLRQYQNVFLQLHESHHSGFNKDAQENSGC